MSRKLQAPYKSLENSSRLCLFGGMQTSLPPRSFSSFLGRFLLIAVIFVALALPAFLAYGGSAPLVIIRFNQPQVSYERPLYNAVSRAAQVKPSVMFDVVATAKDEETAQTYGQKVVQSLNRIGVPASRITFSSMTGDIAPQVEVYVR